MTSVTECPERSEFKFKGKCPIRTCQYNTLITVNGCLALDRRETSDRSISPQEIMVYKAGILPEYVTQSDKPEQHVRRYIASARNIMALYCFINHISEYVSDKTYTHVLTHSSVCDEVDTFVRSHIIEYKEWMLPHLADAELFSAYLEETRALAYSDVSLAASLGLTPKKFLAFQSDVCLLSSPEFRNKLDSALIK